MKKYILLFLLGLLSISIDIIPQKYQVKYSYLSPHNSNLKIYSNIGNIRINYTDLDKDYILFVINETDFFKLEPLPYKIEGGWKYYNLSDPKVKRYYNGKRIFEIKSTEFLQELTINTNTPNRKIIITLYDTSEIIINFN